MDVNNQKDQSNQNSQDRQNNPYGNTMPAEIPIPDLKGAGADAESPYGQNASYYVQGGASPYGQSSTEQAQNFFYGPQEQQYIPPNPKKGMAVKILIAVACVVVAVFAIVGAGVAYFRSTAAYKLGKGLQNLVRESEQIRNPLAEKVGLEDILLMMAAEGSYVSTQFNFTSEELYGTTFGIDTECYKDVRNKEMSADTSLSMMNYEFAHLNIYADEEAFCFSVPELFLEDMYIRNEDVVSQYNRSILAEMTGISDAEDFSIDLFAAEDDRLSLREWKTLDSFAERYKEDFDACRDKTVMEKAEKGLYRVVLPGKEMDALLHDMMNTYESVYTMTGEGIWWEDYDRLIDSDVSVLFEIDRQNRIESIVFEEPVKMLDGEASMEGSLHFLGDERSIDKLQGEMIVDGADGVERSLHFQILQTAEDDVYELDMDIELMEETDSILRMKYVSDSDAVKDEFTVDFSMWDDIEDIELILEGSLDDIVRGRSLEMELDKLAMNMDGEELFKVTGNILIEPFEGEISSTVQKKTAFFEMTEDDWMEIAYKIDDAYGGLMNYMSYLWW